MYRLPALLAALALCALALPARADTPQAAPPDGFGTRLPPGVAAGDVVRLLLPDADPALATLVGMKRWPHGRDTYIAIACIAPNQASKAGALEFSNGQPICQPDLVEMVPGSNPGDVIPSGHYTIAIAMVRMPESARPALASSPVSWRHSAASPLGAKWDHTNLDGPLGARLANRQPGQKKVPHMIYPTALYAFDFARYAIRKNTIAFGIRSGVTEGYAGGGASFQILTLFALVNGELRMVFSQPISYTKDLAGEWNDDGTRNHEEHEGDNIVIVSKPGSDGFSTLTVKSKNDREWHQEFHWDRKALRYAADE